MGEVFRGSVRDTDAPVAVKVLKPELVSDPEIVARFVQERSILQSITHPNIVRVLDLVVEGATVGIVMELVENQDLRRELTARPTLPPAEIVRYGCELLDGLAAVHNAGIVHRDIKPENLLVDATSGEPRLKLTDFGVARLTYGGSLTKLSSLIGTPEYMAPEIADHESAAPAADLYSTGIVLYEMLSGRTAFAGGHPMAVLRRHLDEPPPPIPGAPTLMWALIASLLDKDPTGRPRSAQDAGAALAAITPSVADLPALPPMPAPVFQPAGRRSISRPGTQVVAGIALATDQASQTPVPADSGGLTIDAPARPAKVTPMPTGGPADWAGTASGQRGAETVQRRGEHGSAGSQAVPLGAASGPSARSRRGLRIAIASSAIVLVAAGAATALLLRHPAATSRVSFAPSRPASYVFQPQAYGGGLLIVRRWTLSGPGGSLFTETVSATSADGRPHQVTFFEAIPNAIAPTVQTVRFTPAAVVVQPDPLVQWQLRLPAQGTVTVGYRASVPPAGATQARLARWARALAVLQKQLHLNIPATIDIKSLVISPATIQLIQDQTLRLNLQGQLATGSHISPEILAGAAWTSADPTIAAVTRSGLVTATGVGTTYVTAKVAGVLASASISVTPQPVIPVVTPSSPPVSTSSPAPVGTSSPPTFEYQVFHTCRSQQPCGLNIRSGPGTSYEVLGQLQNNQTVQIVCQTAGQLETNAKGVSTYVWDQLLQGGYVSDLYIDTPGSPISTSSSGYTDGIPRC